MRKKAGIQEVLDNSDGSDYETEQVFKQLRPNAGYKLMDLLTGKVKLPKKKLYKRPPPAQRQQAPAARVPAKQYKSQASRQNQSARFFGDTKRAASQLREPNPLMLINEYRQPSSYATSNNFHAALSSKNIV